MSRVRRARSGVTSVEFALVATCLFVLIQMVLELGWQGATEIALQRGAHDALRFAITGNSSVAGATGAPSCRAATIVWLVTSGAPTVLNASNLQVSTSVGTGAAVGSTGAGFGGTATQTVSYIFTYRQPYATPFARMATGATSLVHSVSIVAKNEPYVTQPC